MFCISKQMLSPLRSYTIFCELLRERQAIGLATIYRALETLKLHGLIKSRMGANGEALYSPVVSDQY
jgi:Fur family ferric uptake transcriptional regulator